jgi:hypothetical protein
MKSAAFWDETQYVSYNNYVLEELITSIIRMKRISERPYLASYCQRCAYLADSFHPDDRGDTFSRNLCSYKCHTASHPR